MLLSLNILSLDVDVKKTSIRPLFHIRIITPRTFVMFIPVFITLVASFSLRNLPISEKMFVLLCLNVSYEKIDI